MSRTTVLAFASACIFATVWACVGDDPNSSASSSSGGTGDGGSSSGGSSGASSSGASSGDDAATCAAPKAQCGPTCADLQTDKSHCGRCDHDCGGGECTGGVCQPATIASGIEGPVSLAVNPNVVVWLRQGAVESCPIGPCSAPKNISGEGNTYPGTMSNDEVTGRRIVATATDVFWIGDPTPSTTPYVIYKCPLSGCLGGVAGKFRPNDNERPTQLAVLDNDIFIAFKVPEITRCDATQPTCASPFTISGASGDPTFSIAVDPDRIYWTIPKGPTPGNFGGAFACPRQGCGGSPTTLSDPGYSIAVHAGVAYINQYGRIGSCNAVTGCSGTPKELAPNQDQKTHIVADGNGVYWLQRGNENAEAGAPSGRVLMCSLPDCAGGVRELATGQAAPRSLAVQDGFVYWANGGTGAAKSGSIMRVKY